MNFSLRGISLFSWKKKASQYSEQTLEIFNPKLTMLVNISSSKFPLEESILSRPRRVGIIFNLECVSTGHRSEVAREKKGCRKRNENLRTEIDFPMQFFFNTQITRMSKLVKFSWITLLIQASSQKA